MTNTEIYKKLKTPLPEEAVGKHPSKTFLSTIKGIYVTERLCDVFGVDGWEVDPEMLHHFTHTNSKGGTVFTVVCKTKLTIKSLGLTHACIASSTNDDFGDAAKGAITDAITKMASWLGVGIDIYKGSTGKPDAREWLNPNTPNYEAVENKIKSKTWTVADAEKFFKLSAETKTKLSAI